MKTVARMAPYTAVLLVLILLFLGLVPTIAFSPPSSVPYTAAAYADRAKLGNATGVTGLSAYASPGACPAQVNLFSKNVSYSIPVLSLPGRAGLGLNLTLSYNSKVWVKSGSTIYFDGDKGWPGIGWRLGFGRIDGVYSGPDGYNHYYLISGDGSVRDLRYNASTALYESRDSTWMDFNDSTGVLRYKDGTQVTFAAIGGFVLPAQIKDRNGNYLTINYNGSGQNISSIVDTAGRTVMFSYNGDGTLASISKTGFGGAARTWSFAYTNITLSYNFGSLTVNGPSSGSQVKVLSSLTFPNGAQQAFTYNSYAQVTEATIKSSSGLVRGKFLTGWQAAPGGGWTDSPTPATVENFDGTNTNNWSLTFNTYSTTVTDPVGVPVTTTFLQTGGWDDGLPSQTQVGLPVLRTMAKVWGNDGALANPRPIVVTTTINDTNQQSKVEYDYISYGNVREVREYDYGFILKRRFATDYVSDANYLNRHILALPLTVTIYDDVGTAKSRTSYVYDAAPLTYAGGAANHDDANYSSAFVYRGLITTLSQDVNPSGGGGTISHSKTYDMLGNLRAESVDCCVEKQYNYSSVTQYSQPDSVVRGLGTTLTTSATYDNNTGLLATSTDENSKQTSYNYDVIDRVTSVTRPDNTMLSTGYDDASATASTTSTTPIESGKSVKRTTEFDGLSHTKRVTFTDVNNNVYSKVDTLFDSLGRTWKVSNPYVGPSASYWTETQYDALGRVFKVIPPDGSPTSNNISYSYSGSTVIVTDQTGKQRMTRSDALGRVVEVTEPDPVNNNLLTLTTTYGYDPMGNLIQVNQGVQGRTNVYDGLSRLVSEATSEAGPVSYQYDNHSLLVRRTDARGVVTTYTYDTALNRLTRIDYNTGGTSAAPTSSVGFTYGTNPAQNNNGRLVTMTDGTGQESYSYEQLGRRIQVQKYIYPQTYTTNYTYNLTGDVATVMYPSGRIIQNFFDAIGRVQYILDTWAGTYHASNVQYNPGNQVTGFNYGNGVSASFGYSAQRLQLISLNYTQGPQTLLNVAYGYTQNGGNNGEVTQITDNFQPGRTVSYTYDSLHRLKTAVTTGSAQYPRWGLQWTYDRYSNRTAQTVTAGSAPSNSVTIDATTNRIIDPGYSYDAAGNMTADGLNTMTYDAENRMVSSATGGITTNYSYDGNGLRVQKQGGGASTQYVFSDQKKVIAEYVNSGLNREYVHFRGQLLATLQGSTPTYHLRDQLSIRANTTTGGGGEQAHYPFGELWYAWGTTTKWFFTSYERDSESGNDYAVFREHSARIGRFLMADPKQGQFANPQVLNRYPYVANDPVNRLDPLGLMVWNPDSVRAQIPEPMPDRCVWGAGIGWFSINFCQGVFSSGGGGGDSGGGGGGTPCNCRWWDLYCWFVCGIIDQPRPGCEATERNKPQLQSMCNQGDIVIKEFICNGEGSCCREKKRAFIDWCYDLGQDPKSGFEYTYAMESRAVFHVHCCGARKKK